MRGKVLVVVRVVADRLWLEGTHTVLVAADGQGEDSPSQPQALEVMVSTSPHGDDDQRPSLGHELLACALVVLARLWQRVELAVEAAFLLAAPLQGKEKFYVISVRRRDSVQQRLASEYSEEGESRAPLAVHAPHSQTDIPPASCPANCEKLCLLVANHFHSHFQHTSKGIDDLEPARERWWLAKTHARKEAQQHPTTAPARADLLNSHSFHLL